jgi:endopeptidase Clp ATP-binding regulatory subunit ClpX
MASNVRGGGPVALGFDLSRPAGRTPRDRDKAPARETPRPVQSPANDPLLQVSKPKPARESFAFRLKPRDIRRHLDRFVVRQDEAKKVLSVALCDHFQHVRLTREGDVAPHYVKQNVLILGPTGVGKTHLIRSAAELIGVPFVKADATKFSETGYVGGDVEELVRDLIRKANGDLERASQGIVYLDEIDKIASREAGTRDVSGRGVQTNLLKLMEDADVPVQPPGEAASSPGPRGRDQTINTRHILFIASGAFAGLDEVVRQRLRKAAATAVKQTGTSADGAPNPASDSPGAALAEQASTRDFIDYGFEPEFIGRLPVRVSCRALDAGDLFHVMRDSESSLLHQYERAFRAYGIVVRFREPGLRRIAELAASENTGARGLMTVCERILRDFKFELPSSRVRELVVDRAVVDDPATALRSLLRRPRTSPAP